MVLQKENVTSHARVVRILPTSLNSRSSVKDMNKCSGEKGSTVKENTVNDTLLTVLNLTRDCVCLTRKSWALYPERDKIACSLKFYD